MNGEISSALNCLTIMVSKLIYKIKNINFFVYFIKNYRIIYTLNKITLIRIILFNIYRKIYAIIQEIIEKNVIY